MSRIIKQIIVPKGNIRKIHLDTSPQRKINPDASPHLTSPRLNNPGGQMKKLPLSRPALTSPFEDDLTKLRVAAMAVQKIRLGAQHELELAKKMRADAQRYQMETETKARSEAQQLILRARLSTQKEIEELIRQASAEIQKVLADIRVIRITAQEELAAQRKFTDAARLCSLTLNIQQEETIELERKDKKQLVGKK